MINDNRCRHKGSIDGMLLIPTFKTFKGPSAIGSMDDKTRGSLSESIACLIMICRQTSELET
jgi:hypothetical protein